MNIADDSTQAITRALAALDGPVGEGAFACRSNLPANTLALSVDGFGDLRLPISITRAKALARIAIPAPFGLGRATLIDPGVRNVGEIKASKVRLDRRAWNRELKPVLEMMRVELGLPDGRLTARLDKLLIYGPGQFFKPHKDTERNDDMVGTLVVVLPSRHKGGSLVVSHQGKTRRFVIRNPADPLLRLFAFYATCEHEVRPVTEGHRVVLSHELRFKRAEKKGVAQVDPALRNALETWFDPAREPARTYAPDTEKLVFLLDHDYSQRSLAWRRLKGVDHRRAEAIQRAAESLGLQAHLALVRVSETWSASVEEPDYYSGRGGRRGWYEDDEYDDDEDDDDDESTADYELDELIERTASLDHWRETSDRMASLPALQAYDDELCWLSGLEDKDPVFEEYEGFMGNYGNTLEREYRRAAVVLWSGRDRYRILARAGGEQGGATALSELVRDAAELDMVSLKAAVHSMLDVWPGWQRSQDSTLLGKALALSSHLDDADIVIELLRSFSLAALKPARLKALLSLGHQHGADFCQQLFAYWSGVNPSNPVRDLPASLNHKQRYGRGFDREADRHRLEWLPTFAVFCRRVNAWNGDAWHGLTATLFDTLYALVVENQAKHHAMVSTKARRQNVVREGSQLEALLDAAREIDERKIERVIVMLIRELEHYASEVPIVVLENIAKNSAEGERDETFEALKIKTRNLVHERVVKAIRAKGDWRIDVATSCKCADCQTLTRFLRSEEQAIDLPLAKDRRRHLHDRISGLEIPVSHSTRRQGRPFVLELRKLDRLYKEAALEHARECALADRAVLK